MSQLKLKEPLLDEEGEKYGPKPPTDRQWRTLFILNFIAAIVHGVSFFGALGIAIWAQISDNINAIPGVLTWDFGNLIVNGTLVDLNTTNPIASPQFVGPYPLVWVDIAFPFITCLFHAGIAWSLRNPNGYYQRELTERNRNPLRWIEYSLTATLMTYIICQLVGISNIFLLLAVAVFGNVILQLQGHLMETLNSNQSKGINWWPTAIGWIIFLGQWVCIWTYFLYAAFADPVGPPVFVYVIVIGLFVSYAIFGLIQLMHYARFRNFLSSTFAVEVAYITLSFTSKLYLTWTFLGALLRAAFAP